MRPSNDRRGSSTQPRLSLPPRMSRHASERPGLVENEQPAAGPGTPAVILHDQVAVRRGHPLAEEQLAEVHQRVGQHDAAFQPPDPLVQPPRRLRRRGPWPRPPWPIGPVGSLPWRENRPRGYFAGRRAACGPSPGGRAVAAAYDCGVSSSLSSRRHASWTSSQRSSSGACSPASWPAGRRSASSPLPAVSQRGGDAAAEPVEPAGRLLRGHRLLELVYSARPASAVGRQDDRRQRDRLARLEAQPGGLVRDGWSSTTRSRWSPSMAARKRQGPSPPSATSSPPCVGAVGQQHDRQRAGVVERRGPAGLQRELAEREVGAEGVHPGQSQPGLVPRPPSRTTSRPAPWRVVENALDAWYVGPPAYAITGSQWVVSQ